MALEFRTLGPLEVLEDSRRLELGAPLQRALLAILLLHANEVVPRSRLIDELWADAPPETAVNVLQGYVSGLRKALGRERIITAGRGYAIEVSAGELDLHRFERLFAAGAEALADGRCEEAAATLREALAVWRGQALADLAGGGFAAPHVARLDELHLLAVERRLEADLAGGAGPELIPELEQLIAEHPLRERLRECHMLALYRAGRQADALAVYTETRELLTRELGIEPGPALHARQRQILQQDPALRGGDVSPAERAILVAPLDPSALGPLVAVAEPLAQRTRRELILAQLVGDAGLLTAAASVANEARAALLSRTVPARAASFVSHSRALDLVRVATEQDVDLILQSAHPNLLDDPETAALLERAPCDVALYVPRRSVGAGPVLVPFGGSDHDWAAVELGAWISQASGLPLRLAGPRMDAERDATRLLASASLAVQRGLGVAAEPLLLDPGEDELLRASAGAELVVVGVPEGWRQTGLGPVRLALAERGRCSLLLVHRGLRPGGLAPAASTTRFTWSLRPAAAQEPLSE